MSRAKRWASLAVLTSSLFVITMDMTILNIALPQIAAELKPTADQQLWIIDIYSLILAGMLVSFAAIADRIGRKRMLLLGYLLFAISSLGALVVDSAWQVIVLRAALGLGGAMIMPTTLSLLRVIFTDPRERATALSVWAAVSAIGSAVGPLLGGVLLENFSWHAAFLFNTPVMLLAAAVALVVLPESRVTNPGPWDVIAALQSLVGMSLLLWAIKTFAAKSSFLLPDALLAGGVGAVLLIAFTRRCLKSPAPLLDLRLFRSRLFSSGIMAALGASFAMSAAFLLLTQWIQIVDELSPVATGLLLLPAAIAGMIGSLLAPFIAERSSVRAVLAGGMAISGIGVLLLAVQPGRIHFATILATLILVGLGNSSLTLGSIIIMRGTSEDKAGSAGALEETAYELGAVLGVAFLGSLAAFSYRNFLADSSSFAQLSRDLAAQAQDSLGAAAAIAAQVHIPELLQQAGTAFTLAMQLTGVLCAIIMLGVALGAFILVPRNTTLSDDQPESASSRA